MSHRALARGAPVADLAPALPVVAVLVWWCFEGGGYPPSQWYPAALLLLALCAVLTLGHRGLELSRPVTAALGVLAAYVIWSYASIAWALDRATALEGSNRALLYLLLAIAIATIPWTPTALRTAAGLVLAAVVSAAVLTLARLGLGDDPARLLVNGRLSDPVGYQNAAAALWTMGALPSIDLASRRGLPFVLRGLLLGGGSALLGLAVLAQSRGWAFTLPVVLATALLVVPGRWRFGVALIVAGGCLAPFVPTLLELYDVGGGPLGAVSDDVGPEARGAARAVALAFGLATLAGIALAFADRAPERTRQPRRGRATRVVGLLLLALSAGMLGAYALTDGHPRQKLDRAWDEFRDVRPEAAEGQRSRYTSLGSSRYDFWRVSVDLAGERLVAGYGQDNFSAEYLQRRRADEEPRWTHSLPLRLLVHTGMVGALLFAGFLVLLGLAWRSVSPGGRASSAALLLPGVVWVVQGSVDWFWEMPVLSGLALAGAVAACCSGPQPANRLRVSGRGRVLVAVACLMGAVALAPAYLSLRETELAAGTRDPQSALERLDRARRLNPFASRPDVVAGTVAYRAGRLGESRRRLAAAEERDPGDWFAPFLAGLVAAEQRDPTVAVFAFARSLKRNPRERLIVQARRSLETTRPLTLGKALVVLRTRVQRRLGRKR